MKIDNYILSDHQKKFSYRRPHLQKAERGDVILSVRITLPVGMTNKAVNSYFPVFPASF